MKAPPYSRMPPDLSTSYIQSVYLFQEERGQGEAIAKNLFEMSSLKVPVLSIVIGEGGSGGALAMAVANEVWMMENAIYSILSPEGFASILYKDTSDSAAIGESGLLVMQAVRIPCSRRQNLWYLN